MARLNKIIKRRRPKNKDNKRGSRKNLLNRMSNSSQPMSNPMQSNGFGFMNNGPTQRTPERNLSNRDNTVPPLRQELGRRTPERNLDERRKRIMPMPKRIRPRPPKRVSPRSNLLQRLIR